MNVAVAGSGSDVPELVDEAFGVVITATHPVIVERSMYSDVNGVTWPQAPAPRERGCRRTRPFPS